MTPAGIGARARRRAGAARCGSSRWRWSTAWPAPRRSARRRTCGRRPTPGRRSTCRPTALAPLEPYRDYLTIVSNTDCRNAEAFTRAGDRRRSFPIGGGLPDAVASAPDPGLGRLRRHVARSDLRAGQFGQDTPIPSMQLCIESVDQSGGCFYGYSCAYTDSISWASPTEPLPMIRDPRAVFDHAVRRRRDAGGARPPPRKDKQPAGLGDDVGRGAEGRRRRRRPRPPRRLPRQRARDRAPHPEGRGAQRERRGARAADGADRRARLLRRPRAADVRPAGARVCRRTSRASSRSS